MTGLGFSQRESALPTSHSYCSAGSQQSESQCLYTAHQLPLYYLMTITFDRVGEIWFALQEPLAISSLKSSECHKCVTLCLNPRSYNPSQGALWFLQCPNTRISTKSQQYQRPQRSVSKLRVGEGHALCYDTFNKWLLSHSVVSYTKYNYTMSKM